MSLFQIISEFFDSIFHKSSPEVQKKQLLKKFETQLKEMRPVLCKNGMLQPNFGEAIFALYKNTLPLDRLFLATVSPNDVLRQHRFEAQLIITAYSPQELQLLNKISYEARKEEAQSDIANLDRVFARQRKTMETLLRDLNTEKFKKMDQDILNLRQFVEFCHYGFVPFLQSFDSNFIPADFSYMPSYSEVSASRALNLLEDLYYQTAGLRIDTALAEAVLALAELKKGNELSDTERNNYLGNIKKINYVLNRILTRQNLKLLIQVSHSDENFEPSKANYSGSPRQDFANMIQERYNSDDQKIKSEIQESTISDEIQELFGDVPLEELSAYNQTYNNMLQNETPSSFKWILPLRILKTFLHIYLPAGVKSLLNDLVIEGFFNNPTYKSSFSSQVYAVINAEDEFNTFEESFKQDQRNNIAMLESYIKDSKRNKDFISRLDKMVTSINEEAHEVLQSICTNLWSLYKALDDIVADAKKPSSELISNLKVLMFSSRNRDNSNFLESHYENWNIFFEIMKNYVIINSGDMSHE